MLYLHKEDLWILPNKTYNHIRIDVTGISRLRLRKNANIPCDEQLKNDDLKWMQHVMRDLGCVPIYWKFLLDHDQTITNVCNSTKQYQEFSKYLARKQRNKVYEVFDQYSSPCTRMRILSNIKFSDHYEKEKVRLDFRYLARDFEEIRNVRDLDLETLVGNIGGYVGMIMGVSILQLSYLFVVAVKTLLKSLEINMKKN